MSILLRIGDPDMSQSNSKGSHLSLSNREYIEVALNMELQLLEMSEHINKDKTTISKEIKRNRIVTTRNPENIQKQCKYKGKCSLNHACGNKKCTTLCKRCKTFNCYSVCSSFEQRTCRKLERFPHVCNGCQSKVGCKLVKYNYRAKAAHECYSKQLSGSRQGVDLTADELENLDNLVTPLVNKGQSLYHIHSTQSNQIKCSERTLYNYFEMNLFKARNIDLPRKVKMKPRKKKASQSLRNTTYNIGRKYEDYEKIMSEHPSTKVVQMDTVYNNKGGQALLTLQFTHLGLLLGYLIESVTIECVNDAINKLYSQVGHDLFVKHFQVLLTDNGGEFKAPERLEYNDENVKRTKVFYCDPYCSYQKANLENNHIQIRKVLPKKKAFPILTQEKVTLMINHINSLNRAGLGGKTAYAYACEELGEELLSKLGLEPITPEDVHLKPALLK